MKYYLLKLRTIFNKKILKYFIIEFILITIYAFLMSEGNEYYELIMGINVINLNNEPMEILIRIINTSVIMLSTSIIYTYDLTRNVEYIFLREDKKKIYMKHLIACIIYNTSMMIVFFLLYLILFKNINMDAIKIFITGIINTIYIIAITTSIINFISSKKNVLLVMSLSLLVLNIIKISNLGYLEFIITTFLIIYNYNIFNPREVFNKLN